MISGYKKPFKKKDGTYKEHVRIEDIYALYYFDDQLKELFLKYILLIEKHIKSLISYSFCEEYGVIVFRYLLDNEAFIKFIETLKMAID